MRLVLLQGWPFKDDDSYEYFMIHQYNYKWASSLSRPKRFASGSGNKNIICYCDLSLPSKTSRHALVFDDESNLVEFKRRRIIYLIFLSFPFAKLPPWRRLKRNGASPDKKSYETIYLCCCSFPFLLWSQFYFNKRKLEKIELKDFLFPMLQIVGFCWIVWLPCDNQERTSAKRFLFSIFLFSD